MESISLYELSTDLVELMDLEEAEINEEVRTEIMEQIEAMIAEKSENIIAVVKNYEATINAIKEEEKRLADNRKVKENKLSRLKEYTKECLERTGNKKVETKLGNISLRKTPAKVVITDEEQLPMKYILEEVVTKIDKKAILADMKELGITEGNGARLETGTTLMIK